MALHRLVVLTNPVAGRENDYNAWYTDQHLADVLDVPGFVGAQRYKLTSPLQGNHQYQYLAIYEVETDDPQASLQALNARAGTAAMVVSDAMSTDVYAGLFEPITALVRARAAAPVE